LVGAWSTAAITAAAVFTGVTAGAGAGWAGAAAGSAEVASADASIASSPSTSVSRTSAKVALSILSAADAALLAPAVSGRAAGWAMGRKSTAAIPVLANNTSAPVAGAKLSRGLQRLRQ
jgi:hypothetical protein